MAKKKGDDWFYFMSWGKNSQGQKGEGKAVFERKKWQNYLK